MGTKIAEVMTGRPRAVTRQTSIREAAQLMGEEDVGSLPIVDEATRLVGIVTDRDIRLNLPSPATSLSVWEMNFLLAKLTVRDVMTRAVMLVDPKRSAAEAAQIMLMHKISALPVTEGERLVGIITERDLLLKLDQTHLDGPIGELMTPDPEVLTPDAPIVYALNKMSVGGFRHVPLVDEAHRPVGIVSVKDIIDYIVDFFPNDVLTVPPDPARGERWRGRDGG
jgi:acetoin utilization protein AcuB